MSILGKVNCFGECLAGRIAINSTTNRVGLLGGLILLLVRHQAGEIHCLECFHVFLVPTFAVLPQVLNLFRCQHSGRERWHLWLGHCVTSIAVLSGTVGVPLHKDKARLVRPKGSNCPSVVHQNGLVEPLGFITLGSNCSVRTSKRLMVSIPRLVLVIWEITQSGYLGSGLPPSSLAARCPAGGAGWPVPRPGFWVAVRPA